LIVRPVKEMGDDEGLVPINRNQLILREDVYEGACADSPRDLASRFQTEAPTSKDMHFFEGSHREQVLKRLYN
jgi:hypothetical protein